MADQRYNRVDLAIELLDVALSLFLKGKSFVSALTLAGAAAEILAKALSDRGEQNYLDWKYETFEPVHTILDGAPLSKEDFIRDENRALIAVRSASKPSVTLDLEDAALWMIVRACFDSDRLGLPHTATRRKFDNWFDEHVIGVESENAFYGSESAFYEDVVGVEFP
jgi:hypothetical protein